MFIIYINNTKFATRMEYELYKIIFKSEITKHFDSGEDLKLCTKSTYNIKVN